MKNLIYLLIIIIILSSCSSTKEIHKVKEQITTSSIEVDPLIKTHYEDFLNDAKVRGINVNKVLKDSLIAIVVIVDDPEPIFDGFYSVWQSMVFIDSSVLDNRLRAKLVLYHELAHVFDVRHTCFSCMDIMSRYMESYDIYQNKEIYNSEVDKLFEQIKSKL